MNKFAIFDVDGTLLDPLKGVSDSICYATQTMGLPDIPESVIKTFIGPPIQISIAKYYSINSDKANKIAALFREQYKRQDVYKAVVYQGIKELLRLLVIDNKFMLAIASNKRQDYLIPLLEEKGLASYFRFIHGSDFQQTLTKMDIINKCIQDIGEKNKPNILMIGDTLNDAIGAQSAGIKFIGVTYGYGLSSIDDLKGIPFIKVVDNIKQLKEALLQGV